MSNDLLTNERQELSDAMVRHGIPAHMHDGISGYVFEGWHVGDFLTALLENAGWHTVLGRADDKNRERLMAYGYLLHNEVPSACWGSPEKVKAWRERGGLKGGEHAPST